MEIIPHKYVFGLCNLAVSCVTARATTVLDITYVAELVEHSGSCSGIFSM